MEVRGTALRSLLVACDAVYGQGASDRVRAALDPALREAVSGTILGTSWYPVRLQAALHDDAVAGRLQGTLELAGGREARARVAGFRSTSAQVVLTWNR